MREPSTYLRRPMPCTPGRRAFPATKRNLALRSPHTQPQSWKEPAGATLVAGSRRQGIRTDKARRGPARTAGRFRETGSRVENPRSKPDPARRAINKRPRTRPFLSGSPQAWPRGWHPPALAPRPKAQRDAKGEPTPETTTNIPNRIREPTQVARRNKSRHDRTSMFRDPAVSHTVYTAVVFTSARMAAGMTSRARRPYIGHSAG